MFACGLAAAPKGQQVDTSECNHLIARVAPKPQPDSPRPDRATLPTMGGILRTRSGMWALAAEGRLARAQMSLSCDLFAHSQGVGFCSRRCGLLQLDWFCLIDIISVT
jgi:hypothetical protein